MTLTVQLTVYLLCYQLTSNKTTVIAVILTNGLGVWLHKNGLQGHHISHPSITSCGRDILRTCLLAKIGTRELLQHIMESTDHITGIDEPIHTYSMQQNPS